jgi:hypothetical protein
MKHCTNPSCKTPLPDFATSCPKCGQQFKAGASTPPPPRPSATAPQIKPTPSVAPASPSSTTSSNETSNSPAEKPKKKGLLIGGGIAVIAVIALMVLGYSKEENTFPFLGIVYASNCYKPNSDPFVAIANGKGIDFYSPSNTGTLDIENFDIVEVHEGGGGQKMVFFTSSSLKRFMRVFMDTKSFEVTEMVEDGKTTFDSQKDGKAPIFKACPKNSAAATYLSSLSPKIAPALK